jgi:hypothetical protein
MKSGRKCTARYKIAGSADTPKIIGAIIRQSPLPFHLMRMGQRIILTALVSFGL